MKYEFISSSKIKRGKNTFGRISYRENGVRKVLDCSIDNLDQYISKFKYGLDKPTLNALTKKYLEHRQQLVRNRQNGGYEGIKLRTYDTDYNWIKNHILKHWGSMLIDDINERFILDTVKPFLKNPLNYRTFSTGRKIYNQLQKILDFGMERSIIKPIRFFKFTSKSDGRNVEPKTIRPIPTIDEVRKIISIVSPYYRVFLFTLATTGLRAGECLGLQWSDINFAKKQMTIKRTVSPKGIDIPKTENGFRTIPLPDYLIGMLKKFKLDIHKYVQLSQPTDFIFPDTKGSYKNIDICRTNSIYFANKKLGYKVDLQSFRRFYRTEMELIFDELNLNKMVLNYRFGHSARNVAEQHYIDRKRVNDSENESVNILANKII